MEDPDESLRFEVLISTMGQSGKKVPYEGIDSCAEIMRNPTVSEFAESITCKHMK